MSTIALNYPALNRLSLNSEADLVSTGDLAQILHFFFGPIQQNASRRGPLLRDIEDALEAPARTILLYGDRAPGNTFAQILAAYRLPGKDPMSDETVPAGCPPGSTLMLRSGDGLDDKTTFVIDEFDETANDAERARFADFINQIAERDLPVRFVLCGVSEALKKLLGAHESSYDSADLMRPGTKCEALEANMRRPGDAPPYNSPPHTVAPHYVHLLSERLFWEMYSDPTFARSLI